MRRVRGALALLTACLLLAAPVVAQSNASRANLISATCPGTGCVNLSVSGAGGVAVQVTGTFVGTLTFEGSIDGVTYAALNLTPINSTTATSTATSTGVWSGGVGGLAVVRVRMSAYTSGTATVSIQNAPTSARGGGGGGSGTGTSTDTEVLFNNAGQVDGFGSWTGSALGLPAATGHPGTLTTTGADNAVALWLHPKETTSGGFVAVTPTDPSTWAPAIKSFVGSTRFVVAADAADGTNYPDTVLWGGGSINPAMYFMNSEGTLAVPTTTTKAATVLAFTEYVLGWHTATGPVFGGSIVMPIEGDATATGIPLSFEVLLSNGTDAIEAIHVRPNGVFLGGIAEPDLSCCDGPTSNGYSVVATGSGQLIQSNLVSAGATFGPELSVYQSGGTVTAPTDASLDQQVYGEQYLAYGGGAYNYLANYRIGVSATELTSGSAILRVYGSHFVGLGLDASTGVGTLTGDFQVSGNYKSADGTNGATVAACTSFKNGLCVAGT